MSMRLAGSAQAYSEIFNLEILSDDWSTAYSINDGGQIVGGDNNSYGWPYATIFDPTGGQANISLNEAGKTITAYYEANASFEKGDAIIKVTSIKRGEEWKIYGFHINSNALIQ